MSLYQEIISKHLIILFERGDLVTPMVILASCERWFITDLCTKYGYVPAFSPESPVGFRYVDDEDQAKTNTGYVQFVGIKTILPC